MASIVHLATSAKKGQAGWAWRRVNGSDVESGQGSDPGASNYRLALVSLAEALESLPKGAEVVVRMKDPTLYKVVTQWFDRWESRGFRKKGGLRDADVLRRIGAARAGKTLHYDKIDKRDHPDDVAVKDLAVQAAADGAAAPPDPTKGRIEITAETPRIIGYTDGGCRGNPGVGGWGYVLIDRRTGTTVEARDGERNTTNNRMEMTAALRLLQAFKRDGVVVEIRSDSKYLIDLSSKWRHGWKKRGWKKANGDPIANPDLVQALDEQLNRHRVSWKWVAGHSGEPGNEAVDELANHAMDALRKGQDPAKITRLTECPFKLD